MSKYTHTVTEAEAEEKLTINQIIKRNFKFSRRFKTKMKFQALIDLNGEPSPGFLTPKPGDIISIRLPEEGSDFPPEDIPVDIIYEDDDIIIVNKQPGLIVHPTKGHPYHTLANGLMKYMLDNDKNFKIRFANRVDMDTSGIIVVAKNSNVQNDISLQLRRKSVEKKYLAIVKGIMEDDEQRIDLPVGRPDPEDVKRGILSEENGGKSAVSDIKVIERFRDHTLVEVTILTGRTHQIRVHLSHIGHPIAGDKLYGGEEPELIDRQALHAYRITFDHPGNGEKLSIEAPPPADFREALEKLKQNR